MALGFDPDVVGEIGGRSVLEASAGVRLDRLSSDREGHAGVSSSAAVHLSLDLEFLAGRMFELHVLEVLAIDARGEEGRAAETAVHLDRLTVCENRSHWRHRRTREIDVHAVQRERAGGEARNNSPQLIAERICAQ